MNKFLNTVLESNIGHIVGDLNYDFDDVEASGSIKPFCNPNNAVVSTKEWGSL